MWRMFFPAAALVMASAAQAAEPVLLRCKVQMETNFITKRVEPSPARAAGDPKGFVQFLWLPAQRGLCRLEGERCASTALNVRVRDADKPLIATLMFGPGLVDGDALLDLKTGEWRIERKTGHSAAAAFDRVEAGGAGSCQPRPVGALAQAMTPAPSPADPNLDILCAGRFLAAANIRDAHSKDATMPQAQRDEWAKEAQTWLAAANMMASRAKARRVGSTLETDVTSEALAFIQRDQTTRDFQLKTCNAFINGQPLP